MCRQVVMAVSVVIQKNIVFTETQTIIIANAIGQIHIQKI